MIWPKISIITPCYNANIFLERTIQSVLDQGYPNLEYIVVDGGSTDGTVDIIKRYADRLSWWVSEPDGGQYDAINKGISHAEGEIIAWLNSDDIYFSWTLDAVGKWFNSFPTIQWISGEVCFVNRFNQVFETRLISGGLSRELAARGCYNDMMAGFLPQEGMFWRKSLWQKSGGYCDTSLRLAADFELWTRFAQFADPVSAKCLVAAFRKHPQEQRSSQQRDSYLQEVESVCQKLPRAPRLWRLAGRSYKTNLIYRYLTQFGASETIEYDLQQDAWQHLRRTSGRLYRPYVIRRKI